MFKSLLTSLLVFSFIILLTNAVSAQKPGGRPGQGDKPGGNGSKEGVGVVSGTLLDETTKERIEYGNVVLFRAKDSTIVTGTVTDGKGKFVIEKIPIGKYFLKASFIGYKEQSFPAFSITAQIVNVIVGDISIKPVASSIEGVTITAEKSLITNNLDKKVISVSKEMALSGGTAVDIMQNVPSVAVDAEGTVSLRGNSNITLLIDGKPASQAGISSSDILNQLPASAIESVEVITNPSVRYDPDGTSGIINIVLKKKALQGFNGMISGTAGTNDKYNGSLNLNYRANKINIFGGIDGRYNPMATSSHVINTSLFNGVSDSTVQDQSGSMHRNSLNFSGGVDYTIDTRNNLTLSIQKRTMAFGQEGTTNYWNYMGKDTLSDHYSRTTNSDRSVHSMNYTLSYKHTFAEKGRELTQDFIVNDNRQENDQYINTQYYFPASQTGTDTVYKQHNNSVNKNYMLTAQGNYVHPFENGGRLETGYKTTYRNMAMDNSYNILKDVGGLKDRYDYAEQLYAVYGIYAGTISKLKYQAGLRFEQVYSHSKINQTDTAFDNNYASLYPSLHLEYDLGHGNELQFSYSRRVDRPSPREMNPYIDYTDSLNIHQGNPGLKPQYTNSLEMGVQKFWENYSATATIFYRNTLGVVEDVTHLEASGVRFTKPENITKSQSYGAEFIATASPYKWLKVNANASLDQAKVRAMPEFDIAATERFSWSGRVNASFNYSKSGAFQLIGNYTSPVRELQTVEARDYSIDASVRQDFFKSKLTVSLRATDIFNTRNHNSVTNGTQFSTISTRHIESRVLYLGCQLKINNYNRKAQRENMNNDMQEEGF